MYREIVMKIAIGGYQSNGFEEATEHARNHKLGKQTQTWKNGRFYGMNIANLRVERGFFSNQQDVSQDQYVGT